MRSVDSLRPTGRLLHPLFPGAPAVGKDLFAPEGKGSFGGRRGYALLDNRGALGGRRAGYRLGHLPHVPPLALAARLEPRDRSGAAAGIGRMRWVPYEEAREGQIIPEGS